MSRHIKVATTGELVEEQLVQNGSSILDSDGMMLDDDKIHPSHYLSMDKDLEDKGIDAITCMRAAFGSEAVQNFCICNALKYLYRHEGKGGKVDLEKCKWYIDKYIELKYYE